MIIFKTSEHAVIKDENTGHHRVCVNRGHLGILTEEHHFQDKSLKYGTVLFNTE